MTHKFMLALALAIVLGWQTTATAQSEPAKFIGTWQAEFSVDGFTELLDIKIVKGQWLIQIAWLQGNVPVGGAIGVNPFFADGKLKFISKFLKSPRKSWTDNSENTAEIRADGKLHYHVKTSAFQQANRIMKLVVASPEAVAAMAKKFIGKWESRTEGLKELWEIEVEKGKILINMTYFDKEKEVGSAKGINAGVIGEELKFYHKYTKKPKDDWADNAVGSLKVNGDKIQYAFNAGLVAGSRELIKPGTGIPAHPNPNNPNPNNPNPNNPNPNNPNPVSAADAKPFLGSWEGEADGFKEYWFVSMEGAQLAIKCYLVKNGEKLGAFTGRNLVVADGKLTFIQEFGPQPAGTSWINGATITVTPGENSMSYTWSVGASSGGPRVIQKRN